jgi:glycosyltransferase involved in cell wall biosynthesis
MKLSIIIPAYNLEEYISLTLDSLLRINFSRNYEIIVVNDGSTDNTENIIKEYQKNNSQIKLITLKNSGVSMARNIGIKNSCGDYITFVDGDDIVDPNFFEIGINEMESGGYDFIQTNFQKVNNNEVTYFQYVDKDVVIDNRNEMYRSFFSPKNNLVYNSVWGKIYKSSLVKDIQFDLNVTVSEDQKYIFDLIHKCNKIKLLNIIGIHYMQRESSTMNTLNENKIKNQINILNYYKENVSDSIVISYLDWHILNTYIELYCYYLLEDRGNCSDVYKAIKTININKIFKFNSYKRKLGIFLLFYARCIFDFYIKSVGGYYGKKNK